MVGKLKISSQAEAVRQLFMALEKYAKRIKTCWFCGVQLPELKVANQGYLTGSHNSDCPLEELAAAGEQCIIVRKDGPDSKQAAEKTLAEGVERLFAAMTRENAPICPFPICEYPFDLGHRLECPLSALRKARRRA
jgi:hypothetical protein